MAKLGQATIGDDLISKLVQPQSSKDLFLKNFRVLVLGPPGEGKTVLGVTASEQCPKVLPAKKLTKLSDIALVEYDNGGADSLTGLNLEVEDVTDLSGITGELVRQANQAVFERLRKRAEAGEIKTVVIDSITTLDVLFKGIAMNLASGKLNMYDIMLNDHAKFFQMWKAFPGNVVFVAHGKVATVMADRENPSVEEVAKLKLATEGLKPGDIRIDVTGQGANLYRRNISLILPVSKTGAIGKEQFNVFPYGDGKCETKSRVRGLERKEPANLNQLFTKIKGERDL